MWQHNYAPVAGSMGLSAIVAAIPIVVLFVMLGVLRRPAWMAALSALGSAVLVALVAYGMPVSLAIVSADLTSTAARSLPCSITRSISCPAESLQKSRSGSSSET